MAAIQAQPKPVDAVGAGGSHHALAAGQAVGPHPEHDCEIICEAGCPLGSLDGQVAITVKERRVADFAVRAGRGVDAVDRFGIHCISHIDIVAIGGSDNRVLMFENTGLGKFTEHVIAEDSEHPTEVYCADISGDGYLDIITSQWESDVT